MTEKDDELLVSQFFAENQIEIEDAGFSHNVARQLPKRARRVYKLWTVMCWAAGLLFFLLGDGIDHLRNLLSGIAGNLIGLVASLQAPILSPVILSLAILTLVSVWGYNVVMSEQP